MGSNARLEGKEYMLLGKGLQWSGVEVRSGLLTPLPFLFEFLRAFILL